MVQTQVHVWMPGANRRTQAMCSAMMNEERAAANKRAAELRAENAVVLAGPKVDGSMIVVPSFNWQPEAVREWHARGGTFHDGCLFTETVTVHGQVYTETVSIGAWTIPARRANLVEVRAIYERCFAREIAMAKASMRQYEK